MSSTENGITLAIPECEPCSNEAPEIPEQLV